MLRPPVSDTHQQWCRDDKCCQPLGVRARAAEQRRYAIPRTLALELDDIRRLPFEAASTFQLPAFHHATATSAQTPHSLAIVCERCTASCCEMADDVQQPAAAVSAIAPVDGQPADPTAVADSSNGALQTAAAAPAPSAPLFKRKSHKQTAARRPLSSTLNDEEDEKEKGESIESVPRPAHVQSEYSRRPSQLRPLCADFGLPLSRLCLYRLAL